MRISFLFLLFPVAELALLIKVGSAIGVLATFLLLFMSAVVGVLMIRLAGFTTALRAREALALGQMPEREMLQGVVLAVAGGLFILPGFLSDIAALLLLFPPTRYWLLVSLQRRIEAQVRSQQASTEAHSGQSRSHSKPHQPEVIEGEWERRDK